MKPKFSLRNCFFAAATLAVSSMHLSAATIELDLTTNNSDPIALADSETTYTFSFSDFEINFLIVAGGGGGGGSHDHSSNAGGGGGAGGLLEGNTAIGGVQTITVGDGGKGGVGGTGSNPQPGDQGEASIAFGLTALGGGGGGTYYGGAGNGGSGGGAGSRSSLTGGERGETLDEDQGYDGGARVGTGAGAASGGGAGGAGVDTTSNNAGRNGGAAVTLEITGAEVKYAGGGGGGGSSGGGSSETGGNGGSGSSNGSNAWNNTGGGGGGGGSSQRPGGKGGSGIVVVRYEGPQVLVGGDDFIDGDHIVHRFLETGASTLGFNASVDGDISGEGDLVWDGGGTLTLGGTNTFTGNTSINTGTLLINGDSSGATGDLTVNNNTTLGGGGSFGGDVTVAASGNLAPGASIGTLTIGGSLDVSAMAGGAGLLHFELGPISASDRIAVGGALDIGSESLGFSDFNFTNAGDLQEGSYTLITSSNLTGTLDPDDLTGTLGDFDAELQISGDDVILVLGDAPPPPADGYATWAETNAPTGGPDDDFDGDGVPNAIEYVLGGTSTTNDLDKLPVATTDSGSLVFTFLRHPQSLDGTTSVQIEVGTDLVTWPTLYTVGPDTESSSEGVTVEDDFEGTGLDKITLSIAQDPDDKKFARLKVTVGE